MSIFTRFFSRRSASVSPAPADAARPAQAPQRTGAFRTAATFFSNFFTIDLAMYTPEAEVLAAVQEARNVRNPIASSSSISANPSSEEANP